MNPGTTARKLRGPPGQPHRLGPGLDGRGRRTDTPCPCRSGHGLPVIRTW